VQVEASLQLSVYSYAATMAGFADEGDVRLRFDVLTKTKQPELGVAMTAERSLLRTMAAAQRELTLALEERKRARRGLRKAEERGGAARRQVRLILQSAEPMPSAARCGECGATLGATPHCMTCAAARAFLDP
jgi:hypothetical protein